MQNLAPTSEAAERHRFTNSFGRTQRSLIAAGSSATRSVG